MSVKPILKRPAEVDQRPFKRHHSAPPLLAKRVAAEALSPERLKRQRSDPSDALYQLRQVKHGVGSPLIKNTGARFKTVLKTQNENAVALVSSPQKSRTPAEEAIVAEQEIRILQQLQGGPHILKYETSFSNPGKRYTIIAQKLGPDLFTTYLDRRNPNRDILYLEDFERITKQWLEALDYMHDRSIAHRDNKPENFSSDGYLFDFGLSEILKSQNPRHHRGGTLLYCAPESILTGRMSLAGDLWALGVSLFSLAAEDYLVSVPRSRTITQDDINTLHALQERLLVKFTPSSFRSDCFDQDGKLKPKSFEKALLPVADVLTRIFKNPETGLIPPKEAAFIDLVARLLKVDPKERITAKEALQHPFFTGPTSSDVCFHLDLPKNTDTKPFSLRVLEETGAVVYTTSLYHWVPSSCYHIPQSAAPYRFEILDRENHVLCSLEHKLESDHQKIGFPPLFAHTPLEERSVSRELFPENPA